jgi:uncharacterized protein YtpQ (UPF0354 family)
VPLLKRIEPSGLDDPIVLPDKDIPVTEVLAEVLLVAYVFDLPGAFRYVSFDDCARLEVPAGELRALAVRNLTRLRTRPQIKQGPAAATFVLDGNLEASLLLVDHLWDQIGPHLPGDLIAAVPARDSLAVTGSEIPGGVDALNDAVERVWQRSETRLLLTRSLLTRNGATWGRYTG